MSNEIKGLKSALAARLAEVNETIARLEADALKLRRAIDALGSESHLEPTQGKPSPPANRQRLPKNNLTIKQMVVDVLQNRSGYGHSNDILGWINEDYDINLIRTSLSPQLSRLRKAGVLEYDQTNRTWRLGDNASSPIIQP
jgi:hypothetical protein